MVEMNRIMRLSLAKIKANKKESILLGILVMICVVLFSSSVTALSGIGTITPKMVSESGCYENTVIISQKLYTDMFLMFLEEDERVEKYDHFPVASFDGLATVKKGDEETTVTLSFVTESAERSFENFEVETELCDEEISKMAHPVYLERISVRKLNLKEGDEITVETNEKSFTFTVAGFYNAGIWPLGSKAIITPDDYSQIEGYISRDEVIAINLKEGVDETAFFKEFKAYCKEVSKNDISKGYIDYTYEVCKQSNSINMSLMSIIVVCMAGLTVISIMVMIRFRIVGDIKDQIVSIGVLEALGYTSSQIASSYVIEYMLIATAAVILGVVPGALTAKALLKNAAVTVNYGGNISIDVALFVISILAIFLFIAFTAYSKARSVRKYPPVKAFRKGIETHHFKKSVLPLERTKSSVHNRLALRGFLDNVRGNIGLCVCISIASIAVLIGVILAGALGNSQKVLMTVCGHQLADIKITTVGAVAPEDFAGELESYGEVKRVLLTAEAAGVEIVDRNSTVSLDVYDDYAYTDSIVVTSGRLPEHDNEIAMTTGAAGITKAKVGETLTIEYNKVRMDYIVTGFVNSVVNANTAYMTSAGLKRISPTYRPDSFEIYLEDGVDAKDFAERLEEKYGKTVVDLSKSEVTGETLEERIRSAAEIKMAKAMLESGVSYMEYAITIGDTTIESSTSLMKIESVSFVKADYMEMLDQFCVIFKVLSVVLSIVCAIVVMIILSILMESTIRKQYRELGIMKGIGYTSKELMYQMAMRIVPTAIVAVAIGSFVSVALAGAIEMVLAKIAVSIATVLITDAAILAFTFFAAYRGAKKIKNISVYELMTE